MGAFAQSQGDPRIGYTNQEAILANMPEMEQVRATLREETQQQRQELQQEQQELQEKVAKYQKQQALLSEERKSEREQELRQMQQELQQSMQERDQYLSKREAELMQPLLDKLQTAINEIAESRGLDVVLRTQALLYVNEDNVVDITPAVADQLGIEVDSTQTGPSPETMDTGIDTGTGNQQK